MAKHRHAKQMELIHQIAVEFHRRAFGEEMARVNFLPLGERKKYLARIRQRVLRQRRRRKEPLFLAG